MDRRTKLWWMAFGLIATLISLIPVSAFSSDWNGCSEQIPHNLTLHRAGVKLCGEDFAILHSAEHRSGIVSIERLTLASILDAGEDRVADFRADARLPRGQRGELSDYRGSGYDRGHLAAHANRTTDRAVGDAMLLSNVAPQHPVLNRGAWAKIESDTRRYVLRATGSVFVITGVLHGGRKGLAGNVSVPSSWWKLVYDQDKRRAWGWVLPNDSSARITAPMNYGEFSARVGHLLIGVQ